MVSIIIRTKDREVFLKRALQSIGKQSYKEIEAIIINNSQTALKIKSEEYPYPVTIIEKTEEMTLARSINKGISAAKGKWITILDDDDTWEPDYLQKHLNKLQEDKQLKASASLTNLVMEEYKEDRLEELERKPFNKKLCTTFWCLLYHNRFTTNAFIFLKEAAMDIGLYDEKLNELEDWDFNLRFARKYRIGRIKEYLSNYHKRIDGLSLGSMANTNIQRHLQADRKVRDKFIHNPEFGPISKILIIAYGLLVGLKTKIRKIIAK